MQEKKMAEAVIRGETVDISERLAKTKRMASRVKSREGSSTLRYIGVLAVAAAVFAGLSVLSGLDNVKIYHYASLILTVIMAVAIIPWEKRPRLPVACLVTFAAMIAGTVILLVNPFHSADTPVYIVTIAIMAGVVWECLSLLWLYNRSCSNPLPQFESHTGGEML